MTEQTQKSIEEIEGKMADLKNFIDGVNLKTGPVREELEKLNVAAHEAQVKANAKAEELRALWPSDWFKIKREYGQLANARMTLRQLLKKE